MFYRFNTNEGGVKKVPWSASDYGHDTQNFCSSTASWRSSVVTIPRAVGHRLPRYRERIYLSATISHYIFPFRSVLKIYLDPLINGKRKSSSDPKDKHDDN